MVVSVPAFADTAEDYTPHLIDNADLLTGEEESNLLAKLDEISDRLSVDVAVVTEDSIGDKTPREYADDFYDYNSYKYNPDGVLLLISMEERDWYITTTGSAITAITDARRGNMEDAFLSDLSGGYYYDAFSTYADMCDKYISGVQSGYYEEGEAYEESTVGNFPWGPAILVSLAIGLIAALVVTGFMRGQLKTVRRKAAASDYVRPRQHERGVCKRRVPLLAREPHGKAEGQRFFRRLRNAHVVLRHDPRRWRRKVLILPARR